MANSFMDRLNLFYPGQPNKIAGARRVMDELANSSPSVADGLPWETEESFRMLGCQLIQQAGLLLKMSNSSLLTGQILFHQLYCKKSFLALPVIDGAMAALFVAGKVEECYRRARDLVNVFHWIHGKMRGGRGPGRLPYICDEYYKWRDRLTSAEMVLLSVLGFHVQPDGKDAVLLLISYLQTFEVGKGCELGQMALNILNDSFRTVCCLIYRPNVMACAAIQIAAESTGSGVWCTRPNNDGGVYGGDEESWTGKV